MPDRQDYARQCAADMGGLDEAQLEQAWCQGCIQVECVRSGLGKANRFEDRVTNWHERLFTKVPLMPQTDPRFLPIARQGFLTLDVGPMPEVRSTSTWHDPRDLAQDDPVAAAVAAHVQAPSRFVAEPPAPTPPAVDPPPPAPVVTAPTAATVQPAAVPAPAVQPPQPAAKPRAPLNTPAQTGRMIERPLSAPSAPPVLDPWSAPAKPANPSEVVVPRGAKIKVGG